jgi:hypothetical protein
MALGRIELSDQVLGFYCFVEVWHNWLDDVKRLINLVVVSLLRISSCQVLFKVLNRIKLGDLSDGQIKCSTLFQKLVALESFLDQLDVRYKVRSQFA